MHRCCCNSRHLNPFFHGVFHFIVISAVFTDYAIYDWADAAESNEGTDDGGCVILNVVWRILVVTVFVVVEVIAVAIIINHEIKRRIITNCTVIIERSIIYI